MVWSLKPLELQHFFKGSEVNMAHFMGSGTSVGGGIFSGRGWHISWGFDFGPWLMVGGVASMEGDG